MKLNHSLSTSIKSLVSVFALAVAAPLEAQQQWWFDVEIIVFKRLESAEDLKENFGSWVPIDTDTSIDLITPYLFPDVEYVRNSLPLCYPQTTPLPSLDSLEQDVLALETLAGVSKEALNDERVSAPNNNVQNNTSVIEDESTYTDATDNLFSQLEQEQQNIDQPLSDNLEVQAIPKEVLKEAFNHLFLPVDHDIAWIDVEPIESVACQFEAETRYLADLLNPFELKPKVIDQTPRVINPPHEEYIGKPYLLPQKSFELATMARDLNRQRGVRIVSHMTWRQEVLFGRSKAQPFRLLAGKNYGNEYQVDGKKHSISKQVSLIDTENAVIPDELSTNNNNDLMTQVSAIIQGESPDKSIEQILFDSERAVLDKQKTVDKSQGGQIAEATYYPPVWEVDGLFKVYLQLLGGVPYLHIDSQLNYRQPGKLPIDNELALFKGLNSPLNNDPEAFLHSYQFQQLRRIISQQIHYFDHPAFGLIVQLRRYRPPANDEE